MTRSRSYLRQVRRQAIQRKKRIIRQQNDYWVYRHDGELAKGKIHCSCPLCRRKSFDEAKISDVRKSDKAIEQLLEEGPVGVQTAHKIQSRTKSCQRLSGKGLQSSFLPSF